MAFCHGLDYYTKTNIWNLRLQKTYRSLNLNFCSRIQSELHTILAQVNNAVMINITLYQKKKYTNRFFNFFFPFVARLKLNRFSFVSSCQTSSDTSKSRRSCTNAFQYFICNYYALRIVLYLKVYKFYHLSLILVFRGLSACKIESREENS